MKATAQSVLLLLVMAAQGQPSFEFTTFSNRQIHDRRLRDSVIRVALQRPLTQATEQKWQGAFWAMELLLYKTAFTKQKIAEAWKGISKTTEGFQKALLEASYTLYPNSFTNDAMALMLATPSDAMFVRCAEYLLKAKDKIAFEPVIKWWLNERMNRSAFTGLTILKERLAVKPRTKLPPSKDIFSNDFLPRQTIVYSLQRRARNYPGLVIIRKSDGSFVKNGNGVFFHTSQLARAITNYPFYITNGNTPQGIFRWTGFDTSTNNYIGPTPNLQLTMPFEARPPEFFPEGVMGYRPWTKDLYASLLPPSWKDYDGIYQSFYAGQMGRTEIIMHGTAINPSYYKGQSYYPQTPSLGCLCSYEEWNAKGKRTVSNQQRIVDALQGTGAKEGYVVVIDLDDKKAPVQLREIVSLLK